MTRLSLVAVACTSAALLVTELAFTRIFSVVFHYHLSFLAISIALFGLGAGGVLSYLASEKNGNFYARLGRRYPRTILIVQYQLAHVVALGGIGLLALYQRMSEGDFVRLLVAIQAIILLENLFAIHTTVRLLRPAQRWLDGDREPGRAVAAWRALVNLPADLARARQVSATLLVTVPWAIYATLELGLSAFSAVILIGGGLVIVIYGVMLRYLGMELTLRPVIEDVAADLPDGAVLGRSGVPLRWKLLAGLPLINIITGVAVAGLSSSGPTSLHDLGLDVVVAVLVAFTISLELTLLLSKSILRPIEDMRATAARVGAGDLRARVHVVTNDELGGLSRTFNAAVAGLEEREQLREAFGMFVDPDVAEKVLEEGTVFAGEEVDVSVLFLDIRGFTAFAERASAHEVLTRLNEFYDLVVPVLIRHGGHANKFIGDGLLGVFGAPDRQADHADRAAAAALEIVARVRGRYGDMLRIGIGVNSGTVVAGTVGGGGRVEFTVIGDAVNTASRVEQLTRETGDDILITEATRALLTRPTGPLAERPPAQLKGKRETVQIYALGAAATAAEPRATTAGRASP